MIGHLRPQIPAHKPNNVTMPRDGVAGERKGKEIDRSQRLQGAPLYPATYEEARQNFREAASNVGARLEQHTLPNFGPGNSGTICRSMLRYLERLVQIGRLLFTPVSMG